MFVTHIGNRFAELKHRQSYLIPLKQKVQKVNVIVNAEDVITLKAFLRHNKESMKGQRSKVDCNAPVSLR